MTQLVFATNNNFKFQEIKKRTNSILKLLSLSDIGCLEELPETHDTIEENALQKALYIYENYKINCFADDTGLEVEALNGAPGVFSARYAGDNATFEDNMNKLLTALDNEINRSARFRTCIALIEDGKEKFFTGEINGIITNKPKGNKGFGYDPVFQPKQFNITFAEMELSLKNEISHRAIATKKLLEYLDQKYK